MPAISFEHFQTLQLPIAEVVNGRIGYVHDLFLRFPYEIRDELPSGDRDLVVITGKENRQRKLAQLAAHPGRVVLVLAPGDASFRASYLPDTKSLPPNIVAAYVTNNEYVSPRVVNLPLGVRSSNLRAIQFVRQNHKGGRDGLLYGNFTVNDRQYRPQRDHPHIRERLAERLREMPWIKLDVSEEQRSSRDALVAYYREMASHRFVLSPEGNGIDCYRTWESLYLGAIPIVMASTCTSSFADLPILFTDNYSELSEGYLEDRWQAMSQRTYDLSRLMKAFYFEHFLSSVAQLRKPRFVCWGFEGRFRELMHQILERSSRSPSDVFLETPTPPFTPSGVGLMDPSGWTTVGDLRLLPRDGALRIEWSGDNGAVAKLPLETICGAPFRLTVQIDRVDSGGGKGSIKVADKKGVRAEMHLGNEGPRQPAARFRGRDRSNSAADRPRRQSEGRHLAAEPLLPRGDGLKAWNRPCTSPARPSASACTSR